MLSLSPHTHVASFGERAVVLDTRENRYRLVIGRKALALATLDRCADAGAIDALLREGILHRSEPTSAALTPEAPARSALEQDDHRHATFSRSEVTLATARVALCLALCRFDQALSWSLGKTSGDALTPDHHLVDLAHAFERARMHVPLARTCLRDALVLARLLRRRGALCKLIFGVRLDPFGAHSWVQSGDLVLSGSLAAARELMPILVL